MVGRTSDRIMLDVKPRSRIDTTLDPRPSRTRRDGRPSLSVVCVAGDDAPTIFRELAERSARWQRLGVELIIVCAARHSTAATALVTSAGARLIYGPTPASDRQLRSLGLAAAAGDVVMILNDPVTADEAWIERLCTNGGNSAGTAAT
jgi:hypothetical protein